MAEIKISSKEELAKVLTEQHETLMASAEKVKSIEETITSLKAMKALIDEQQTELEMLKQEKEQFAEKVKTLTLAIKAKGTWKETTPEGKAYGLGEFVSWMLKAHGSKSLTAQDKLKEMGALPVRFSTDNGWEPPKGITLNQWYKGDLETKAGLATSTMTGDDASTYYGSYLVPVEYMAELNRVAADASAMMGKVRTVPMRGITAYLPYTTDELVFAAQTSQDTDATIDTLTIARQTLTAVNYYSYVTITEEYDQDSLIILGSLIRDMYGEAWGTKFDSLCLEDSSYGVLANGGVNQKLMSAGSIAFTDLSADDLSDLISELTTRNKRLGAMFFMHPTVLDIVRKIKDALGNYIWQQPTTGVPGAIWGYPYVTTEGMPSASDSAVSTDFIIFGNPKWIVNGNRLGFEFKIFDQTQSTMEAGQIFLRCRLRQGFVTSLPSAFSKLTTAAA